MVIFAFLWSVAHSGNRSSVIAAVQARTCESAVDIVAAKIEARISPTQNGPKTSIANIGSANSGSKLPSSGKITLDANPMRIIKARNGVCHTKNHTQAFLRSSSESSVMILETTCGCPATPNPPRKKAKTHKLNPI